MTGPKYRVAPGLEIVRLEPDHFLLRSEFAAHELSGDSAVDLVDLLLRRLDEPATMEEIVGLMAGYDSAAVTREVENLLAEGVLVRAEAEDLLNPTLTYFLDQIGLGLEAGRLLTDRRVAIFGLEAHGAHVALLLAQMGVGHLVLVDPFPFRRGHLALTPGTGSALVGKSRQEAVAGSLSEWKTDISIPVEKELEREAVANIVGECDLVLGCFDHGFSAAHHWINRAALEVGAAAIFSDLRAAGWYAGPLVIPDHSACYLCYRMRAIACEPAFDRAMSLEEHLDAQKTPRLDERPVLPGLPAHLGSVLGLEVLRELTGITSSTLVDRVMEFDALGSSSREHHLLAKPDCPACGSQKKKRQRQHPELTDLLAGSGRSKTGTELRARLVSPHCGIVTDFGAVPRDPSEPHRPFVWRAMVSNHRFLSERDEAHAVCSGKGFEVEAAQLSALGEAVERYSGGCWSEEDLIFVAAEDLEGSIVDPRDLVLYAPDQYEALPYAPYSAHVPINWVRARSVTSDQLSWVPAVAALMEYEIRTPGEFLFPITSNGLAAAPTLGGAVLSAIYEVLERDAFLTAWCNELPGVSYAALEHPEPRVRELAAAYERRGVRLLLIQLPTDHPVHVVMGLARQERGEGPAVVVGLGADLDLCEAARQAAIEVGQVRPGMRRRALSEDAERVAELADDPSKVATLDDHALLYCHPSLTPAFGFLQGRPGTWPPPERIAPEPALKLLTKYFQSQGMEILYVNLTPPDMESLGIYTARAILPHFQPIWFGREERRLGGRRLFDLPVQLGLQETTRTAETLNALPHPLA